MTERNLKRIIEAEDILVLVWWDMRHMGEDATEEFKKLDWAMDLLYDLKEASKAETNEY